MKSRPQVYPVLKRLLEEEVVKCNNTLRAAARAVDIPVSTFSKYMVDNQRPQPENMARLCAYYHMSEQELLAPKDAHRSARELELDKLLLEAVDGLEESEKHALLVLLNKPAADALDRQLQQQVSIQKGMAIIESQRQPGPPILKSTSAHSK